MQVPENLISAVDRIQPRAVLLLDTNTIMDAPQLDSYEIRADGAFLLVIPRASDLELIRLAKGSADKQTRRKAARAQSNLRRLYKQGNSDVGIELRDGRWLITVDVPRTADSPTLEEELVQRALGKVDAGLLRLARACAAHLPYFPSALITRDTDLTHVAIGLGLSALPVSSLRSAELMTRLLGDVHIAETPTINDFKDMLNADEERSVKVTMTLEELRSEAGLLIARGSGHLTYDGEQFWFRWTFPYENLAKHKRIWETGVGPDEDPVMPLQNLDFIGADEKLPDGVKRHICGILEDSGRCPGWEWETEGWTLQSPLTALRYSLLFHTSMGMMRGDINPHVKELYDQTYYNLMESILKGTAANLGVAYRSAFQLQEDTEEAEMGDVLDDSEDYETKYGVSDLETSLIELLDAALGTWSVGETREEEFTYTPFAFPESEEETFIDDDQLC